MIGFVTNASFIDANNMDGLRKALAKDFSLIYCFNLRGDQRTKGDVSRAEGGKIFGSGSRTPVAITLFIRSPKRKGESNIYYFDVGEYLSREEKLRIISNFKSMKQIEWQKIIPNNAGDWIEKRNEEFGKFIAISQSKTEPGIFSEVMPGIVSARDPWVYNFSLESLKNNMSKTIDFYNSETQRNKKSNAAKLKVESFVAKDKKLISWSSNLFSFAKRGILSSFDKSKVKTAIYRPFTKCGLYYCSMFITRPSRWDSVLPTLNHPNVFLTVTGSGANQFSVFISNTIVDFNFTTPTQCIPMFTYENTDRGEGSDLLDPERKPDKQGYIKWEAITDFAIQIFQKSYDDNKLNKEDIFYYIYALLHSPTYKERYQNDLKKMLPRIPIAKDFWSFSKNGRELAAFHLNYETVAPFNLQEMVSEGAPKKDGERYRVNEIGMKFPKVKKDEDRTTIIYNQYVTLKGIPLEAYDYVVNGKSAIEWIMERYAVTTDKESGIKNDPNEWSDDPRYIVDLVKRIVTISLETNRIVASLPKLELLEEQK